MISQPHWIEISEDGHNAHRAGVPRDANPYMGNTVSRVAWASGWDEEERRNERDASPNTGLRGLGERVVLISTRTRSTR
jgi:hypothetical protein